VYETADWSHRRDYIVAKHKVTSVEADEALADPDRVVLDPDPASKSGRSVRIIGHDHGTRRTDGDRRRGGRRHMGR
jgi:hypothetical protein